MRFEIMQGLAGLGLALALSACGPKLQSVSGSSDNANLDDPNRRETVKVEVNFTEKGAAFRLAAANSYTMALEGCASGLTFASITQAQPSVDVYKFDRNCVVKLKSFIVGGITYTPAASDPFTDWSVGSSATFEEAGKPANKYKVVVTSQLNNPISGSESVAYTFSQLLAGSDESIAKSIVSDNHALSVAGEDAAAVDIVGVNMVNMTAAGAGQFTFKLECLTPITGTAPDFACSGTALVGLKYVLVEDSYGGILTLAQASSFFSSGGTSVAAGDLLPTGTNGAVNGGFNTQTLTGPDAMHSHPSMLLVIQSGGASYKYFNVDISPLTYP